MQCLFGMYLSEKRAGSYFYLKQIGSVWSALGGGVWEGAETPILWDICISYLCLRSNFLFVPKTENGGSGGGGNILCFISYLCQNHVPPYLHIFRDIVPEAN